MPTRATTYLVFIGEKDEEVAYCGYSQDIAVQTLRENRDRVCRVEEWQDGEMLREWSKKEKRRVLKEPNEAKSREEPQEVPPKSPRRAAVRTGEENATRSPSPPP